MENKNTDINFYSFGRSYVGSPIINEQFGYNEWINFGSENGGDNDYPQEILRIYHNSSGLFSAIIRKKADMIAGLGWIQSELNKAFVLNEYSEDDLDMVAYKCAMDYVLFNGFYVNVIWSKDGTSIAQLEHIPYEKVRIAKPNKETEKVEGYYISKDWINYRKTVNKPKYVCKFNEDLAKEEPSQLFFHRGYSPGIEFYTLPTYSSILNWLKLDYEISTFHLKSVQKGFMPGMIIVNKQGIPPAQERETIYNELKEKYSGADNAGDFIMVFAENAEKAPEFIPVQLNASDQRFKDLMGDIDSKIMIGTSTTSQIVGLETAGKLGGKDDIIKEYAIFQSTVITPLQNQMEKTFNRFADINGTGPVKFKEYEVFKGEASIDTPAVGLEMDSNPTVDAAPYVNQVPNDALKGLSAQENADLYRIVRDHSKGKINDHMAIMRLQGYGMSEDQAKKILGLDEPIDNAQILTD